MQTQHSIYIIGICGTFMGGVARLARDLGYRVSGSDANTYPPMSTQLESLGIDLHNGYCENNIPQDVDMVIVGNTIGRGNPELEYVLNNNRAYTSGAQWLGENVLRGRWVLGVSGTHGKTTTSSLLTWLLEDNDLAPGFLIGGVPENFGESSRLGDTPFFVIEADEYDTAFCDKRSKFLHYQPKTLVINNLEFDHADIFKDLSAIQAQFHHLLKTIPQYGQVIHNAQSPAIDEVFELGCWSEQKSFTTSGGNSEDWQVKKLNNEASEFEVIHQGKHYSARWNLIGDHNMENALAAVAAAHHVGVPVANAVRSLAGFKSVKRRLEKIFDAHFLGKRVRVFDDFAHHPTAIEQTVNGLRNSIGEQTLLAVLEPRSNTMKQGVHKHLLADSLQQADQTLFYANDQVKWDVAQLITQPNANKIASFLQIDELLNRLLEQIKKTEGDCNVLIMSNGGFENLYQRLLAELKS